MLTIDIKTLWLQNHPFAFEYSKLSKGSSITNSVYILPISLSKPLLRFSFNQTQIPSILIYQLQKRTSINQVAAIQTSKHWLPNHRSSKLHHQQRFLFLSLIPNQQSSVDSTKNFYQLTAFAFDYEPSTSNSQTAFAFPVQPLAFHSSRDINIEFVKSIHKIDFQ